MPQRAPEDGEINWDWSSKRIYDFIRAQTRPYPGAFTFVNKENIIIWKAEVWTPRDSHQSEALSVQCSDGEYLLIHEIGLDDGSIVYGTEYAYNYLNNNLTPEQWQFGHE